MPGVTLCLAALEITLLHSLWQGAAIALGVWSLGTRAQPQARYAIARAGLLLLPLAAATTFGLALGDLGTVSASGGQGGLVSHMAPWIDSAWLAGCLVLLMRAAFGLWGLSRLAAQAAQAPAWLDALFQATASYMGVSGVRLRLLAEGTGPFTVGLWRAVIYMPVSAVTALAPDQIEAVLAHEFEHIRRHDFAWNLVQTLIEAVFFYHPAVWWLGARMRDDRELCCDDAAVAVCRQELTYASALLALEERRRAASLALALNGHRLSLLSRIRRLVEPEAKASTGHPVFKAFGAAIAVTGACLVALGWPPVQLGAMPLKTAHPQVVLIAAAPARPATPAAKRPVASSPQGVAEYPLPQWRQALAREDAARNSLIVQHPVPEWQRSEDRQDAARNALVIQHPVTPEQAAADYQATRHPA